METVKKIYKQELIQWISISFGITFIIELLNKRSLWLAIRFFCTNPLVFLFNMLIVMVPVCLAYFFKKRIFAMTLISSLLLLLGVTNFVVKSNRVTPFCPTDVLLIGDAIKVLDNYLTWYVVVLIIFGIVLVVTLLVHLWRKAPSCEHKIPIMKKLGVLVATIFLVMVSNELGRVNGLIPKTFSNISDAYQNYGFVCCFTYGIFDTGIAKPSDYDDGVVDQIMEQVSAQIEQEEQLESKVAKEAKEEESKSLNETTETLETTDVTETSETYETAEMQESQESAAVTEEKTKWPADRKPNIIFVQLESFFDLSEMTNIELTRDPTPNFHSFMQEYTSGYLSVPVIGAGTANTEFEVLTGMNLDFFGPGEYPYKTVLKTKTCESMAFDVKNLGYKSHVIHNNTATFYSRDTVFPQLGFDTFTSSEYMVNLEYNEKGWAKDRVLVREIVKTLKSTEEPDLIYTISVQGHGSYPTEKVLETSLVNVTGFEDEGTNNAFTYYANQIYDMDVFVRQLVYTLQNSDEPCVLVMYGDHLPTLGIEQEMIGERNLFETPCIMWDNIGLKKEDLSCEAYQLSSYVFGRLGIHEGVMTKYHQAYMEQLKSEDGGSGKIQLEIPAEGSTKETYLTNLEIMEYDVLYGNQEALIGTTPYQVSNMTMGVEKVKITDASYGSGALILKGQNFTTSSVVYVNEEPMETEYDPNGMLVVRDFIPEDGQIIYVAQYAQKDKKILSKTDSFVIEKVVKVKLHQFNE